MKRKIKIIFWEYLQDSDVICLVETWIEGKTWEKTNRILPDEFSWKNIPGEKAHKKGRAKEGILTGIRKIIQEENVTFQEATNFQERRIMLKGEKYRIFTAHNNENKKDFWEEIKRNIEEPEYENMIIGGDFNARIGEKGSLSWKIEEEPRKSKDTRTNKE